MTWPNAAGSPRSVRSSRPPGARAKVSQLDRGLHLHHVRGHLEHLVHRGTCRRLGCRPGRHRGVRACRLGVQGDRHHGQARLPAPSGDRRRLTENGEFEEVIEDHPLLRVLNGRANPVETGPQFRKRLSAQILLSKRGAFVEVTRSNRGTITRLDLLPPDRVIPVPDPRGEYIAHYEFTTLHGEVRELDPERVRWIRDPHPTDPFSG
ncbi:phage portal protein [Streptomyces sp. ARC14]|uniref:phage portal protein n=1 Tax=Streptomyces sp. ARC14 TaxID=2724152 RepID=UPI0038572359